MHLTFLAVWYTDGLEVVSFSGRLACILWWFSGKPSGVDFFSSTMGILGTELSLDRMLNLWLLLGVSECGVKGKCVSE